MRTAIYIEDGVVQLVLTPESEFEKNALKAFQEKPTQAEIRNGSFYQTRGGWTRHGTDDSSLIMRIVKEPVEQPGFLGVAVPGVKT